MQGAERTWHEQWRAVVGGLMEVGRCNSGQQPASTDVHQVVVDFCQKCYLLKNYLSSDPAVPFPAREAVEAYVSDSRYIRLTGCVASPRPGETVAHVHSVLEQDPPRTIIRIEWDESDGATGSEEALHVATGAISEWRNFLTRHQLVG
jgi:hypothetical protein